MGVCNVCSSLGGGLTIIPGIVKSTANIMGGGRTQWANFFNACFLLSFLFFGRDLINMVPMTVLASILVFIGFKLCRPKVWLKVANIGMEQLFVFTVTILITVTTDLLIGIAAGIALELLMSMWYVGLWHTLRDVSLELPAEPPRPFPEPLPQSGDETRVRRGGVPPVRGRSPVCFNMFHMIRELRHCPHDAWEVYLHLSQRVPLVDHTTCDSLHHFLEEFNSNGDHPNLVIDGWDHVQPLSRHETSMRIALVAAGSFVSTARAEAELQAAQATD